MTNIAKSTHQPPGDVSLRPAGPSSTALPKYLHKRGSSFYFKRKIPRDVIDGFPQYEGQIWKALGTIFLEKAKLLLAVEVTGFDLTVAELRKQKAHLNVDARCLSTGLGNTGNALGRMGPNELMEFQYGVFYRLNGPGARLPHFPELKQVEQSWLSWRLILRCASFRPQAWIEAGNLLLVPWF